MKTKDRRETTRDRSLDDGGSADLQVSIGCADLKVGTAWEPRR
jgi:hypothetical protein